MFVPAMGEFDVSFVLRISASPWHSLKFSSEDQKQQKQLGGGTFLARQNDDDEGDLERIKIHLANICSVWLLRKLENHNEKEEEMQIGHPTDVKHVAHIGMDGPSANTPSWMNEYKPNSEGSSVPSNSEPKGKPATKKSSQGQLAMDITDDPSGAPLDSPTRRHSSKSKQSRRHHSSGGSVGSPSRDPLGTGSKPRRHKNSGDLDSPTRDSPGRTSRIQNSILGSESPSQGQPRIPKQSRQKKTKGSPGGVSSTSSRSKGLDHLDQSLPYSDPGPGPG
ncbi:hypothetical protein RHSIM_Rhsim04G0176500 [Rhododendron simsii]|uniref:CRIB domain-containing protein n=1 Tax=Rhododendron simsii TaxID=118357 RepID=A0A834GZQ0_RHOSS|nr:hypothetical protein RHSIM_Rhsim04G0176500 [Rhododendron simsii]